MSTLTIHGWWWDMQACTADPDVRPDFAAVRVEPPGEHSRVPVAMATDGHLIVVRPVEYDGDEALNVRITASRGGWRATERYVIDLPPLGRRAVLSSHDRPAYALITAAYPWHWRDVVPPSDVLGEVPYGQIGITPELLARAGRALGVARTGGVRLRLAGDALGAIRVTPVLGACGEQDGRFAVVMPRRLDL